MVATFEQLRTKNLKTFNELRAKPPDLGMIAIPREKLPGVWDYDKQLDSLLGDPDKNIEDFIPLDVRYDFGRIIGMTEKPDETKGRMKLSILYKSLAGIEPRISFNLMGELNKIAFNKPIDVQAALKEYTDYYTGAKSYVGAIKHGFRRAGAMMVKQVAGVAKMVGELTLPTPKAREKKVIFPEVRDWGIRQSEKLIEWSGMMNKAVEEYYRENKAEAIQILPGIGYWDTLKEYITEPTNLVQGIVESSPLILEGILGNVFGGTAAAITTMGVPITGQVYIDTRTEGTDVVPAMAQAILTGTGEAAIEQWTLSRKFGLMKNFRRIVADGLPKVLWEGTKVFFRGTAEEGSQEFNRNFWRWVFTDRSQQWTENVAESMAVGGPMELAMAGVFSAAGAIGPAVPKEQQLDRIDKIQEAVQAEPTLFREHKAEIQKELDIVREQVEQDQFKAEVAEIDKELAGIQKGAMAETPTTEAIAAPEKPTEAITEPEAVEVAKKAATEGEKRIRLAKATPEIGLSIPEYTPEGAALDTSEAAAKLETTELDKISQAEIAKKWKNQKTISFRANVEASRAINRYKGIKVAADKGKPSVVKSIDEIQSLIDKAVQEHEKLVEIAQQMEKSGFPTGDVALHSADGLESIRRQIRGLPLKTPETPKGYYIKTTTTEAKPPTLAKAARAIGEPAKVKAITETEVKEFPKEVLTDEQMTKAEMGEIPIEGEYKSQSESFNEHLDYFQNRQLPKTSKIPDIQAQIRTVNGKRLAGSITAQEANKKIRQLRKQLFSTAIKEGVALRMTRGGKVSLSVRKAGTYVPEEFAQYGKFKNISPILGGGQDITRAIQQMDGSLSVKEKLREKGQAGPLERHILWPTRDISIQKLNYIKEKTVELKSIFQTKKGSKEDAQVNLILEQIAKEDRDTPIKDILSRKTLRAIAGPEVIKQALGLREFYDNLIEEQNLAREMRDQDPIPYRHNYSPHILRDTTIWERLMMTGKEPKDVKAELPDYIKPNAPFNPRAMAREAGIEYEKRVKSAQELAETYLVTAAKDIFNTSIIQNNKAFIQQLESMGHDKSANYLADWTAEAYAGVKPRGDRWLSLPRQAEKGARYFNRLRNMAVFPLNWSWSLLTQTSSLALTIGRYGLNNTMQGFREWLNPETRKQATEDYYSYIVKSEKQGRITRQDAQNLIGQNVKLRRSKTELARDISTLLLDQIEKLLTGTSIRAAHLHGEKRGLTGEALKNYASDGGAKTQSMYNDEDKPALLRNLTIKTVAPYQTFSYEVVNTMREWAGKTGTPPDSKLYTIWTVTRFLAAAAVFSAIGKKFGKKEIWSWKRPPIPFAEFWLSPIIKMFSNQWIGSASGLTSPVETAQRIAKGIEDVLEAGSWRKLRKELLTYGPGIFGIPGGVQIERTVDAIIAYSQGGVRDRKGRLMFKMEDPQDLVQAIFSGVWSTKGGREYLEPKKTVRKRIKRSENDKEQ